MFDETKTKGFPFKFQLGGGRIIEGLERGVRGMCKGETRALLVPPELGFDVETIFGCCSLMILFRYNGRGVPSGVVLHYVVDLLAIEDGVLDHLQEVVNTYVIHLHDCDSIRNVKGRQKKNLFIENKIVSGESSSSVF